MSAGYDERDEGRSECLVRQSPREHVAFDVVHADQRFAHGHRNGFDRGKSDQQTARQPGAIGHGDCIHAAGFAGSLLQGRFDRGQQKGQVGPGGQFRHDAPVFDVYALRGDYVG